METMMTMTILSMVTAAAYVAAATIHRRELPESLSAMVYVLPPVGRWLWTVWLWAVALTACVPLMEVMPDGFAWLGFLTLAGLAFVGAMPLCMAEQRRAHYALAVGAGVLSQACVAVLSLWWLVAWPVVFCAAWTWEWHCGWDSPCPLDGKGVLIAEATCALTVYGAVLAVM